MKARERVRRGQAPRKAMVLSVLACALIWGDPGMAQTARQVAVEAGPLGSVLARYAAAAGVQLVFDPAELAGRQSAGLSGSVSVQEGFDRLLAGTGYRVTRDGQGSYVLHRQTGVSDLAPVKVVGQSERATSEGTDSYATQAVTVGKGAQRLRDIPQSVSVVTRQQLDDQNLNSLSDAMRNVTGMNVENLGAGSNIANFVARGYSVDRLQVDGLSTPAGSGNMSAGFDLAMYDRIEVLRGPAGLYQGTGEPGGTINLVRKRPMQDFAFSAQATVGSWDYYRSMVDLNTPFDNEGKVRGRFIAAYEHRGSFMDRVTSERPTLYGVIEADLTPQTTVTAGIAQQYHHSKPSFGLPAYADGTLLDVRRSTNLSADWNRIKEKTFELFADLEHRLDDGGRISASVFYRDADTPTRLFTWANRAVDPATGNTGLVAWSYRNHWKTTGADVNLNLPVQAFGREHSLLVGADYSYTHKDFSYGGGTVFPINIYDPVTDIPKPEMARVNGNDGRVSQFGVYGRLNVQLTDPLKLVAGARLSWWKNDSRNANAYFNEFSQNVDRLNARPTPYAGLIYDLGSQWSVYASYTSIYQPQTEIDVQGATLKPRMGRQIETGVKGELLDGRLNTHAALFQIVDRNRAMTDPDNPLYSIAAGKVRSQGFETEVSGALLPGWEVVAGYAYTDTKYLQAPQSSKGRTFSQLTPRNAVNLWTRYRFSQPALQGWSVGGGLRYSSGFYQQSRDVRWTQGSFTTVSAQVGYRYDKHLEGTLTVDNLFDRVYYEKLGGASRQNYYGTPRSVMLNLRYQY